MTIDFNVLEREAAEAIQESRVEYAVAIYTWMATGDPSLDGGYLGERLGECYDRLQQPYVARYWYQRAVEENPEVCLKARTRLLELASLDGTEFMRNAAGDGAELSDDLLKIESTTR